MRRAPSLSINARLLLTAVVFFACLEVSNELVPHDLTPSREFDAGQAVHEDFRQGGQSLSQNLDRVTIELIGWRSVGRTMTNHSKCRPRTRCGSGC
jgi:hypothetical protein